MPEQKNEPETFNVVDRRRFTSEGERRADVASPPASEPSPAAGPQAPASAVRQAESEPARTARQAYERQTSPASGPKGDLETLVLTLSTSAMYQLGLVEDPAGGQLPPDLEAARHTIDMLGILQEKTRGNLSPQEAQLLEQVLYELRIAYVNLSSDPKRRTPRPKASA